MRVGRDGLHDSCPVQIERPFGEGNIDTVKPFLDTIQRLHGDGIDVCRWAIEILVHKDQVKVLQTELYVVSAIERGWGKSVMYLDALKMGDLDLV